jgi:predicted nucleic acid-binding protein
MLREKGEDAVLDVVGQMRQGLVVDLDADLALEATRLDIEFKLPLADSAILATARLHEATVWTQDEDFDGLDGVRYVAKRNRERREKG